MVTACGSGQVDPSWVTHLTNTSIQKEEDGLEWRLLGAAWTSWWFIIFFLRFSNRLRLGIKIIVVLFSIMRFFNLRYLIFAINNIITFVIVGWMARLCLFKKIILGVLFQSGISYWNNVREWDWWPLDSNSKATCGCTWWNPLCTAKIKKLIDCCSNPRIPN